MKKRTIEKTEFYEECPKCGSEIKGVNEAQFKWNFNVHKNSCKEVKENDKKKKQAK